jgi:DnaD/phage-associated family protein
MEAEESGGVVIFTGFSTDNLIGLPPEFLSQVVPAITLPSELKVTLHIFYRLSRQRGSPRYISWDQLAHDQVLCRSLRAISTLRPVEELLDEGLHAAVQRGTLLHLPLPGDGRLLNWYLVNTAANRAWVARQQQEHAPLTPNAPAPEERPALLTLYEQHIGVITPLILDELREAEERYPYPWIEAAMREAVQANARSWRYVRKILERWATRNGRHHAPDQSERPVELAEYFDGEYSYLFQHYKPRSGSS